MSQPRSAPQGVLELHPKGYGFLRNPARHYAPTAADPYVPAPLIQKLRLAEGLLLGGPLEPPRRGVSGGPRLAAVEQIEGADPKEFRRRAWDELTPVDPTKWLRLETGPEPLTTRVMDMFTPVGMGQRGLIVAPPRTGKTVLLQHIAQAAIKSHPQMHLMVLLVDERPEEVTEMRRSLTGTGRTDPAMIDPPPVEVIASSSDKDTANHIRIAALVVERAKRLTE